MSVTVLITEIRGAVSSTKESLKQMRESNVKEIGDLKIGQERFSKEISEVREVLTQMRISDATSGTAIKELCAQIDANQVKLAQHDIDIMRCRTRVHIIANKIMEMDPKWKLDDKN